MGISEKERNLCIQFEVAQDPRDGLWIERGENTGHSMFLVTDVLHEIYSLVTLLQSILIKKWGVGLKLSLITHKFNSLYSYIESDAHKKTELW